MIKSVYYYREPVNEGLEIEYEDCKPKRDRLISFDRRSGELCPGYWHWHGVRNGMHWPYTPDLLSTWTSVSCVSKLKKLLGVTCDWPTKEASQNVEGWEQAGRGDWF